ncbi:uncharacterized protein LOC134274814 [Saccostrea cucullata]|uniref:uncharacterized protein LOC134274814 n=1 Tax=Saccostrea cuccullata TaxID=36930 RepID=UPI002ED2137B
MDKKARLIFLADVLLSGNENCSKLVMSMKPYVGIMVIRKMCDRCLSMEDIRHPKTKHKVELSAIQENRNLLISELEPMELTDILLEEGALSDQEYKDIMLLDKRGEQATRLLTLLERKDESSLDSFIYALESLGFSVILRKIGTLKRVHNEQ